MVVFPQQSISINVQGVNATSFVRTRLISTHLTLRPTKFSNAEVGISSQPGQCGAPGGWGPTEPPVGRRLHEKGVGAAVTCCNSRTRKPAPLDGKPGFPTGRRELSLRCSLPERDRGALGRSWAPGTRGTRASYPTKLTKLPLSHL